MCYKIPTFLLLSVVLFTSSSATLPFTQGTINLSITGVRSTEGRLLIGVYKSLADIDNESPLLLLKYDKTNLKDGRVKVKEQLPAGTYGLSLLDDENNNEVMDYNFIGIPKEGFGFSNYYHRGLTMPAFERFQFTVQPGGQQSIEIPIRYIQ